MERLPEQHRCLLCARRERRQGPHASRNQHTDLHVRTELPDRTITLGRTLKRRAGDILGYFDHPHTSNGPTEAINGRLEHLRGSALGLAKPHPLHHPSTPRNRRIQTPTTPRIMKSQKTPAKGIST